MSGTEACPDRTHKPDWVVDVYMANYSAFNGYQRTPSDYSEVRCTHASHGVGGGPRWRTKAAYVDTLPGGA
jgi:hypothetical protein